MKIIKTQSYMKKQAQWDRSQLRPTGLDSAPERNPNQDQMDRQSRQQILDRTPKVLELMTEAAHIIDMRKSPWDWDLSEPDLLPTLESALVDFVNSEYGEEDERLSI